MAKRYVTIEKEGTFQNRTERWSNVYLFETTADNATAYEALVDAVIAAERPIHTAAVKFVRGRVFTTIGLNGIGDQGNMYYVKETSVLGTLSNTGSGSFYRECAVLIKWPLPRKVGLLGALGRQRSLKKWIHPFGSGPMTSGQIEGVSALDTTGKAPFLTYAQLVDNGISGATLIAPDGSEPNDTPRVHDYVEHRQFPRGRKEVD